MCMYRFTMVYMIYRYLYTYMYIHTYLHIYICIHTHLYRGKDKATYCVHTHIYIYMYACVHIYIYMCAHGSDGDCKARVSSSFGHIVVQLPHSSVVFYVGAVPDVATGRGYCLDSCPCNAICTPKNEVFCCSHT